MAVAEEAQPSAQPAEGRFAPLSAQVPLRVLLSQYPNYLAPVQAQVQVRRLPSQYLISLQDRPLHFSPSPPQFLVLAPPLLREVRPFQSWESQPSDPHPPSPPPPPYQGTPSFLPIPCSAELAPWPGFFRQKVMASQNPESTESNPPFF